MLNFADTVRRTGVRYCLDCGKCTAVCPVSKYNPQFSPRLIVQNSLHNHGEIAYDRNIWACIGCGMCSIRCSYNVNYVDFVRYLRMKARENGTELIHSHGGVPEAVMHLLGQTDVVQSRRSWLPGDIRVDTASDTAFFIGCARYLDTIFKDLNVRATESAIGAMRLLNMAGITFNVIENERCCGHDLLQAGDAKGFLNLGHANVEEFKKQGIRSIIAACPECYYTLKRDYAEYIGGWDIEVRHLAEITELSATISEGTNADRRQVKATFHDSCRLGRHCKIYDGPRKLLRSVAGLQLIEMDNNRDNALCCGSSPWMFCGAVNKQIQDERLAQAKCTNADYLVTSCPKCQIHLTCAQAASNNSGESIKIVDIYHLISQRLKPKETM